MLGDALPEPVQAVLAGVSISSYRVMRRSTTFTYDGKTYPYFCHRYNLAWRNERAVEVPIARDLLDAYKEQRVLEVGNVMSHYFEVEHDVLDKYESGENIINGDVVEFEPDHPYDLVLSVSTLEHVGWDETPREPGKAAIALNRMTTFLAPGGLLVATIPIGYNRELDGVLEGGSLPFTELRALKRTSRWNAWQEVAPASCRAASYDSASVTARCLYVGYLEKPHGHLSDH